MPEPAPGWWPSGDSVGRRAFLAHLAAVVDERFGATVVDHAAGWIATSLAGAEVQVALAPLADACLGEDPVRWPAVLQRELEVVLAAHSAVVAVDVGDLDRVRGHLRVRVVPAADPVPTDRPAEPFALRVVAGLVAVLVVERGPVRWTVPRRTVDAWSVDPAGLIAEVARRTAFLVWWPRPHVDRSATTVLTTTSPFGSALLLDPSTVVPSDAPRAWFVAAPTARTVVLRPDAGSPTDGAEPLATEVADRYRTGPEPLSPRIHRWSADRGLRPLR